MDEINAFFNELKKDFPKELSQFAHFSSTSKIDGAISKKNKELILVSLSVVKQCDSCIKIHVEDAKKAGASDREILEASMLAVVIGGGSALMYVKKVYESINSN